MEFLGEIIWDRSLERTYHGLTCKVPTSEPVEKKRILGVLSLAWGGRGQAEAKLQ